MVVGIQYKDSDNAWSFGHCFANGHRTKITLWWKTTSTPKTHFWTWTVHYRQCRRHIIFRWGNQTGWWRLSLHVCWWRMADNPRPMMYQSEYAFDVLNPQSADRTTYKMLESFVNLWYFGWKSWTDIKIKWFHCGLRTGAYNYSMASNYNRFVVQRWFSQRSTSKRETYSI